MSEVLAERGVRQRQRATNVWPAALAIDELWLRARRLTVSALVDEGLWMAAGRFGRLRRERRRFGEQLESDLLAAAIGDEDWAYLHSERPFGSHGHRLGARIPAMLAFGYDIGAGLARERTTDSRVCAHAARTCALFNLGIGLFDAVCDTLPHELGTLVATLDEPAVGQLMGEAQRSRALALEAGEMAVPELRIVLRLAAAFFEEIWSLAAGGPGWHQLGSLIVEAYRAELLTAQAQLPVSAALRDAARARSILPFTIMAELARPDDAQATAPPPERGTGHAVGVVFSLLDDLTDLARDVEAGSTNAIIVAAGITQTDPADIARALLNGPEVHDAVADLVATLGRIASREGARCAPDAQTPPLAGSLPLYVQNWLLSDGGDARSERWNQLLREHVGGLR